EDVAGVLAVHEQRAGDAERHLRRADRVLDVAAHRRPGDGAGADHRQRAAELLLEPGAARGDVGLLVALGGEARHELEALAGHLVELGCAGATRAGLRLAHDGAPSPRARSSAQQVPSSATPSSSASRRSTRADPARAPPSAKSARAANAGAPACSAPAAPSASPSIPLGAVTGTATACAPSAAARPRASASSMRPPFAA